MLDKKDRFGKTALFAHSLLWICSGFSTSGLVFTLLMARRDLDSRSLAARRCRRSVVVDPAEDACLLPCGRIDACSEQYWPSVFVACCLLFLQTKRCVRVALASTCRVACIAAKCVARKRAIPRFPVDAFCSHDAMPGSCVALGMEDVLARA